MSSVQNQDSPSDDQSDFHHQEGLRIASTGNLTEALKHFQIATELRPDKPVWHFNLALAFQHLKQLPSAIASYRIAVQLNPDFFDAWNNLAAALKSSGDASGAVLAAQQAVALSPDASGAHLNLGNGLKAAGDWSGAEASYRRALVLDPNNPRIRLNLGNTLRELGRMPEAIALLRQAVDRSPNFPEAHRDLAFAMMLSGDLRPGWIENEWRWQTEEMVKKRRVFDAPMWNGEDLPSRRILIHTEQGFGDAIQFVRYVPLVAKRGAKVILECQAPLARLFESLDGVGELVVRGAPLPPFDCHLPLLSLPRIFSTTLENIPCDIPYLKASPSIAKELPPASKVGFKVGLVWAGNPEHLNDQNRSISLRVLRPLFDSSSISFYSLQLGALAAQLKQDAALARVTDLSPFLRDFATTAAAIDGMDLVISVDTSVAHLAGALGKPVWLLLPYAPDWRWMLGRDDSPWYPTMRLFRQDKLGDWTGIIGKVSAELRSLGR